MFNKSMFISENISKKNSEIMDAYFTLNKKLDNFMDYVDIVCVMPNFSNILHLIAHKAPLDADRFRDYNALYSYRTFYNTIEGQYKDFESPLDGITFIIDHIIDIDILLAEAKDIAKQEENYDYECFIDKEIIHLREYKKQFIIFNDKLEQYLKQGNTMQDFDFRCKSYMTMNIEENL